MLIFRYLSKEVFTTLVALTTILLLIFMSNQFVQYLNRAANGQIPAMLLMQLMMLEIPSLMVLLLPLGFYAALLVSYGRLYAESEMIVLQACGYGPQSLLRHSFIMASFLALFVLIIMLWVSPLIATQRATLLRTTGIQTLIQTIVPGRFRAISGGKQIFYVASMNRDHTVAKGVFLARLAEKEGRKEWDVLWAESAFAERERDSSEDFVILKEGRQYQGMPGQAGYRVAHFDLFKARLPHQTVEIKNDIRTIHTHHLLHANRHDLPKIAELQWRFSVPIMVLTLTLIGVPLSRVNPRMGKYAKLFPAMIIYILYANALFISRDWVVAGKVPIWIGMWWTHVVVALLGVWLIYYNQKTPA